MNHPHPPSEQSGLLAEQVRGGNRQAERQLVDWLTPRLRVIASRRVPPRLIEDVTQETLCAVVQAVRESRIDDESRISSFAYGVLRNVISNLVRSEKGRSSREGKAVRESSQVETETPLDLLIGREEGRRVAACLGSLRKEDREILFLSFYLALPPREVANRLEIQPNVARQRKWRAIQRFTEVYLEASRNGAPPRGVGS
jgi:RNA polymerase sigma factor (sigma-70 family)